MLERAGVVLRVGDVVFLRPESVVREALLAVEEESEAADGRPTSRQRLAELARLPAVAPPMRPAVGVPFSPAPRAA